MLPLWYAAPRSPTTTTSSSCLPWRWLSFWAHVYVTSHQCSTSSLLIDSFHLLSHLHLDIRGYGLDAQTPKVVLFTIQLPLRPLAVDLLFKP